MRKSVYTTLLVLVTLLTVSFHGLQSTSGYFEEDSLVTGPYIDELIFKVITNQDQRVLALFAGEIEMDTSFFDPIHIPTFESDIDIFGTLRNGYGHITINCRDYPLNISGLRRAFAFAYDKTRVTVEAMDGFSQEHDSLVPFTNGWCAEDEFDWYYYTNQADIGNQILDDLGFDINETTGFREAPNGESFDIKIGYASSSDIATNVSQIGVDALHALHIDAEKRPVDYNDGVDEYAEGIVEMQFYSTNFYDNDVDWLADEYWSDNADVVGINLAHFENDTFDSWRNQLLYGVTYEEIDEAATEMQKILHYNVPRLVVYENTYMQGYRNDQFTGHVEDLGRYITGPWTFRKMHNLDGSLGGTVPIAISDDPENLNIFTATSAPSSIILEQLWSSLYKHGPDMSPVPDLAESMKTETHSDNPNVPEGHVRFTFDIIKNATWSDGVPLTADDVAFTFTYTFESGYDGNPASNELLELVSAYAPSPYICIIEFSSESYWHFNNFAFDYVIPSHIFNDNTGIGYDGWDTWNPVYNSTELNVNCGPFIFKEYVAADYYKLERNPLFHYRVVEDLTPTSSTTNQTSPPDTLLPTIAFTAVVSSTGIVIVYCTVSIIQDRKSKKNT